MVEAVAYKPEHLMALALQPAQKWMAGSVTMQQAEALGRCFKTLTVVDGDRVLAVGGIELYWEGRGLLWSYLAGDVRRQFLAGHRIAKRFIEGAGVRRLEAAVDLDFEAGHRWVKALGFELETPVARKYQVDGRDCSIYVRVA